jgi:hypothetical protein
MFSYYESTFKIFNFPYLFFLPILNMKLIQLPLFFVAISIYYDLISATHLKSKYSLKSNSFMKKIDPDYNRTIVEILLSRG